MAYDPVKVKRVTFDMTLEMYERLELLKEKTGKKHVAEVMRDLVDKAAPKAKKGR